MRAIRLVVAGLAMLGIAGLGTGFHGPVPAEAKQPETPAPAYVFGKLDGALADELMDLLKPVKWKKQTDQLLIMAGKSVERLNVKQTQDLLALHAAGKPIVLTNASPDHFNRLHAILRKPVPITLRAPYTHADFYAHARSAFGPKVFAMMPPVAAEGPANPHGQHGPPPAPSETLLQKQARAAELLDWRDNDLRRSRRTGGQPLLGQQGTAGTVLDIYASIQAWEARASFPVSYKWGTCNSKVIGQTYYLDSCQTTYQLFADVWPVYSASNAQNPGNPATDYFVMQLSGNLSPGSCYDFYAGRSHDNRISAYWARTYQFTANVQQNPATQGYWDLQDLAVASGSNPVTANPNVTVQTGTSWNIGGTGTAGASSSVGFSAGASFSNSVTASYQALETTANIGTSDNSSPAQAQWNYDSWNFVSPSIAQGNNACPAGLWQNVAAPTIITTGTFSPVMTYVWEVSKGMRTTYTGQSPCTASCTGGGCTVPPTTQAACLPVEVDLGVLLGWTYFPNEGGQCNDNGDYLLGGDVGGAQTTAWTSDWQPLNSGNPTPSGQDGLYFDVSCGTNTQFGTVPLGPSGLNGNTQNNSIGNPGPLLNSSLQLNIPFAPTSVTP